MSKQIILKSHMYIPKYAQLIYLFKTRVDQEYAKAEEQFPGKFPEPSKSNTDINSVDEYEPGYGVYIYNFNESVNINDTITITEHIEFNEQDPWRSIFSFEGSIRAGELCLYWPDYSIIDSPESEEIKTEFEAKYSELGLKVPPNYNCGNHYIKIDIHKFLEKDTIEGYIPYSITYVTDMKVYPDRYITPEYILSLHYSNLPAYMCFMGTSNSRYDLINRAFSSQYLLATPITLQTTGLPAGSYSITGADKLICYIMDSWGAIVPNNNSNGWWYFGPLFNYDYRYM